MLFSKESGDRRVRERGEKRERSAPKRRRSQRKKEELNKQLAGLFFGRAKRALSGLTKSISNESKSIAYA